MIPLERSSGPPAPSSEELESALSAADEVSLVLRTHQILHAYADRLLFLILPAADLDELQSLRLTTKIDIAVGAGRWPSAERPAFVVLDRLRNVFAHRRDARLDDKRIGDLRNSLGPWLRTTVESQDAAGSPRETFGLIASAVFVCMRIACEKLEAEHDGWRRVNDELRKLRDESKRRRTDLGPDSPV